MGRCTAAWRGACRRCCAACCSPKAGAPWPVGCAAGLGQEFRQYYYFLGSLGPRAGVIAALLLRLAVGVVVPGQRLLFGLDDTPTKRYGPHVEGAGVHHNPTPGPAGQKFLYGHVWVTLALLVRHPLWGSLGLPLRAWLYVRRQHIGRLPRWYRVAFRTKLEMAAEAVAWLADWLKYLGKTLWVVADGAYAKRPFLKAAKAAGVVVVSRLRKDAALWGVPTPPRPGAPSGAVAGRSTARGRSAWPNAPATAAAGRRPTAPSTAPR